MCGLGSGSGPFIVRVFWGDAASCAVVFACRSEFLLVPSRQAMADHCVQRDFFWRLSFKGGTDCDRAQLLGQDLIKDLEASEGICQQLRTHAESMRTGNMTKAFRFFCGRDK